MEDSISVCLFITIIPPVPNAEPAFLRESKSINTSSHLLFGSNGTDEPPGMTAKRLLHPPITSPAYFCIKYFKGTPNSSSTLHGLFTWPEIQKIFDPELFLFPISENHLEPFFSIVGTTAIVSTLFTVVGFPKSPTLAGKGGFRRG